MTIKVTGFLQVEVPFELDLNMSRREFLKMNHREKDGLITGEELNFQQVLEMCENREEITLMQEGLEVDHMEVSQC